MEEEKEFVELEAWLMRNGTFTPMRTEWSIYDEQFVIAGQIDSLWMETDGSKKIVMVDWKRSRKCLDPDLEVQHKEAFGRKGREVCPILPCEFRGACADMYDCAYNHYKVQQHLYSNILEKHYGYVVRRLLLGHCVPGGSRSTIELEYSDKLAESVLRAFDGGWKKVAGL